MASKKDRTAARIKRGGAPPGAYSRWEELNLP
jgi:hypothetical protein